MIGENWGVAARDRNLWILRAAVGKVTGFGIKDSRSAHEGHKLSVMQTDDKKQDVWKSTGLTYTR